MPESNITRRGETYWWRRHITVRSHRIALAISLRCGILKEARRRAAILFGVVEKLKMSYGETGSAIPANQLKQIFQDALQEQLRRILIDQVGSGAPPELHRELNLLHAELYRILNGPDGTLSPREEARLRSNGWSQERINNLFAVTKSYYNGNVISQRQLDAYQEFFGYEPTSSNIARVKSVILSGRSEACLKANDQLGRYVGDLSAWSDDAAGDAAPTIAEQLRARNARPQSAPAPTPSDSAQTARPQPPKPAQKLMLSDAMTQAIAHHRKTNAWSASSAIQVETAIRLFTFACGGDIAIEDLEQDHVTAFHELCANIPTRWGKTTDEREHGLIGSLRYGKKLRMQGDGHRVGLSIETIEKHITWLSAVLDYVKEDDQGKPAHVPAVPLNFRTKGFKIQKRGDEKHKRSTGCTDHRPRCERKHP